jgi:chaperonin GroES
MRKIQPINNNLLIKLDEVKEDTTAGGIIIPDTAQEKSQEGEIVAVPADSDSSLSVGDRVIYKSFSGTEITFEGKQYLIIPSDDILAKFVEVDAI